ncbi:transporter family-2 protein [Lentzea waywayandensis]|uniref:Transporter family-2 protein n=1 Tax=Lentzea waywayandensis TaxID=84724 RepID=A0A1I6DFD8_9PSEU|nr:DMT family transporter [Lentzea waywayandensis]SFR04146.1 transporter family-2 protein [Lentzea waywayandensis]
MYFALLGSALLVGCLLAVQASANLQLTKAVGTPYGASTLQLGLAAVVLAVLAAATGTIGAVALVPDVEPWRLLGGLASPLYITSGILLFPRLGALAAVGLFVTGQMFASVVLDLFGLLGLQQKPLSAGIVIGAVAVLAGITVIAQPMRTRRPGWIVLGIAAGAVLPMQGAINARLRADLHAPIAVALVSFTVATVAIAVVLLFNRTPPPTLVPLKDMPWWGWLGGGCAAAYVTATFLLIPEIGAATTVVLTVTGQQLASALIDHCGLFRMPRRPFTPVRLTGLALLVAGSLLVQFG